MNNSLRKFLLSLLMTILLVSCVPSSESSNPYGIQLPPMEIPLREFATPIPEVVITPTETRLTPVNTPTQTAGIELHAVTPTVTQQPYPIWFAPSVPDALREQVDEWNLPLANSASAASLKLNVAATDDVNSTNWIYAAVVPFPTVLDGVSFSDIESAWAASSSGPLAGLPLYMTESTFDAMTSLLGEAGEGVVDIVSSGELTDALWENLPAWGIVPFESLNPKLKVLTVDNESPIRNDFDEDGYPLKLSFSLTGDTAASFELPRTNRDDSKLTVILMTGVTAMVRATATRMEIAGVDYPAWNIGDILEAADITHISNEIPFFTGCPYPDARQEGLVFCSNPKYIELLEIVGTDVVELTGNHFQDYGDPATLQTLEMYDERGWPYYGGGSDLEDSRKPALLTHNGNRFAFIGCNPVGPGFAWATEDAPGAAPCDDYQWMKDSIADLTNRGYIVIATFQYLEYKQYRPTEQHVKDFHAIADAGATIVNGSQAHIPQAMEFYNSSFVHYGLGNLFFDDMSGPARREFLDRHTFYDGRLISTELVTALLEDFARPRPMNGSERSTFLEMMFGYSDWIETSLTNEN